MRAHAATIASAYSYSARLRQYGAKDGRVMKLAAACRQAGYRY
ncbi:hypothetical protein QP731_17705 [Sphingomonas sp. UMB7805-LC452B]|nr:hypothetical protein [Sphingomonas sp. UMB7805-LC452B]